MIDEIFVPLIPSGSRCAIVDFPNHPNVGDSAIWLGEYTWVRRHGAQVVYTCDAQGYDPDHLAARLGTRGVILLQGGGNLGDLWPEHHEFRLKVIQRFPHYRIIQCPEWIHFQNSETLRRTKRIYEAHPDFTLLVRDRHSLAAARDHFRVPTRLCPDMAFVLGPLSRLSEPQHDLMWLYRRDRPESETLRATTNGQVEWRDWMVEESSVMRRINRTFSRQLRRHPQRLAALVALREPTYPLVARQRLMRGCRTISPARVLITERLHGHILSMLLGIPNVVFDVWYGKVHAFYDTWVQADDHAVWAESAEDALAKAHHLLHRVKAMEAS